MAMATKAPSPSDPSLAQARRCAQALIDSLSSTLSCGRMPIELSVMTLIAGGHLLLEDVPGVGKTTLARALAASVQARANRVQFTSDMLPSDVTGISVFDQQKRAFTFVPGPIFAHLVLADEINRANPKTQAALLECMEERTVSVDGVTHALADPFMVIATQNPVEMSGTFPLPEAQLDRFMCRIRLGYPTAEAETRMLMAPSGFDPVAGMRPVCSLDDVRAAIAATARIHVSPAVAGYATAILAATRAHPDVRLGASPRAGLALLAIARARALLLGQEAVYPGDVRTMAPFVLAHRLLLSDTGTGAATDAARRQVSLVQDVVAGIAAPRGGER